MGVARADIRERGEPALLRKLRASTWIKPAGLHVMPVIVWNLMETLNPISSSRIRYVFTPEGRIVELPLPVQRQSTAYYGACYDIGHAAAGARRPPAAVAATPGDR